MTQEVGTRMEQAEGDIVNLDWEEELRKFQSVIASGTKPLKMKAMVKLARSSKHAPDHVLSRIICILIEIHGQYDSNDSAPSIQEVAAYCLKCIACREMGTHGAIHSLIRLLPHSEGKMQEVLIECLLFLVTFFKSTMRVFVNYGGFRVIMNLLDYPIPNNGTRQYLLEILSVLVLQKDVRKELIRLGALHLIVEATGTGSMISRERACQSFVLFGFSREARRELVELGAISMLAELWRDGDQTTKLTASYALGILSSHVFNDSRPFTQDGVITFYVELLEGPDPSGKEIAEDVLCIVAVKEGSAFEVVGHLVRILRDGDDETKAIVVGVMLEISGHKFSRSVLWDLGAIPILVELLGSGTQKVMESVSGALLQLSFHGSDRMGLAEAGAIAILMDLLHHKNEEVRDHAAEVVVNFYEDPLHHDRVSDAIDVPSFITMQGKITLARLILCQKN